MNNIKKMIDVDAAMAAAFHDPHLTDSEAKVIREFLARQEIIDAKEVVHGRWLSAYEYALKIGMTDPERLEETKKDKWWKFCNDCEQQVKGSHNYCPNCGAIMDGATMRTRLIKLLDDYTEPLSARDIHKADFAEKFADHLIANGVTIPSHTEKGKGNG